MSLTGITAILFDTYGTVVDWRSSIIAEGKSLAAEKGIEGIDWGAFTDAWKDGYRPMMDQVNSGERPWTTNDTLQRRRLDEVLEEFAIMNLSDAEKDDFNRAWHRLQPWPDSIPGMTRLREKYPIGTFSNGSFTLLVNMAKHARLPWDFIISADNFKRFKPHPELYLGAVDLLGGEAERVLLVAAHNYDLANARKHGIKTAFVCRPTMFGPDTDQEQKAEDDWDIITDSIDGVADALGV